MTFRGLDLNNPPEPILPEVSERALIEQKVRWEHALKGAAAWFLWVAGLSLINSVLHLSGLRFQFIFGLGIAQLVDALARRAGGASLLLDIINQWILGGCFCCLLQFRAPGQKIGLPRWNDSLLFGRPPDIVFQSIPWRCISCVRAVLDEWGDCCDFQTAGTRRDQPAFRRASSAVQPVPNKVSRRHSGT